MGLFNFGRGNGRGLFNRKGSEAEEIKKEIERALGSNIQNVAVKFDNGAVSLQGEAKSQAAKEKAVLIAGNIKDVDTVDDSGLRVAGQAAQPAAAAQAAAPAEQPAEFYTIQSGDSLSKIAQRYYGDANAYNKIFEANREVIGDPDKIYPGQQIRIPKQ